MGTQTRKISFHSKSFKKVVYNVQKSYYLKRDRIMHLFQFIYVRQIGLLVSFLVHFLKLLTGSEILRVFEHCSIFHQRNCQGHTCIGTICKL
jgi:hypothetical protein